MMTKLSSAEIESRILKLQSWERVGSSIKRDFKLKDFQHAMGFVVKVALAAEKMDHHPDITIEYNRVKIVLTTHSVEGLTALDFELAEKIDKLFQT
ncbi:MAG: 4a-hydroxytetrahydrobiopterin dehydratase [Candidatus Kryptoniota bacterium]